MNNQEVNVTEKQMEVLLLINEGLSIAQICKRLNVCRHTVLFHITALQLKGVVSRRVNKCPYEVTEIGKSIIN